MRPVFDLHLHSTASDGLWTPSRLVEECAGRNIAVMALSDHDTVEGVDEARQAAGRLGVTLIAATELSVAFSRELHILGYGIDTGSPVLQKFLRDQRDQRRLRLPRILGKLRALGIDIEENDVDEVTGGEVAGRLHVARALVRRGVCGDENEAFNRYLSLGKPAYVGRELPRPRDAIDLIRDAGGRAVLAHPGCMGLEDAELTALTEQLARYGLEGVEAFYPAHDQVFAGKMLRLCRRTGLTPTYGSDCHGPGRGIPPGWDFDRFEPMIPPQSYDFLDSLTAIQTLKE